MSIRPAVTLIGAGLVGSLLATLLAQRGFDVEVFERRPDPRVHGFLGGRSINLALVERGLRPLRMAGLAERVRASAVMMRGRMVHPLEGAPNLQPYGINDAEVDYSVSRGGLNMLLLDAAAQAGARLHFEHGFAAADFNTGVLTLDTPDGSRVTHTAARLIGCDGAGSAVRAAMARRASLGEHIVPLGHGYKELRIPHTADGGFAIEANALHIWPRGNYMCIALPNAEADFTVTAFLPETGPYPSLATLPDVASARRLFEAEFADALRLMPTFDADWTAHPVGQLATLYLERWHLDDKAVVLGDAAHAVVPFHGQGMNAGFEDAAELATLLCERPHDDAGVFAEFQRRRKPNADAIAQMSLNNYVEMRDGVADPHYLLKRELATALTDRAPDHFMSRYRMVSFTSIPYATCVERDRAQSQLMESILHGHASLTGIDLDAAAARARRELPPVPLSD